MTVMTVDDLILALEGKPGDALVFVQQQGMYSPAQLSTWSSSTPDLVFVVPDQKATPVSGSLFDQGWRPVQ